jgi:ParB/RepB/Spo0J family partition protein
LISEIGLDSIVPNPFNSRTKYPFSKIEKLANSLKTSGLLVPVKVRPSPNMPGFYELVYGHRRVQAARKLGWKKIRAEIVSETTDDAMILQSLVENLQREDLMDYEKALVFERMNKEFHQTYEQIGAQVGISRQTVSNYLAMLRLFEPEDIASDPSLLESMQFITEHHARILLRIQDRETRIGFAKLVVRERLSVKELANMAFRFRSWFQVYPQGEDEGCQVEPGRFALRNPKSTEEFNVQKIRELLKTLFDSARNGDFRGFIECYDLTYSLYSSFPPLDRLEGNNAFSREKEWFAFIASKTNVEISDLKITLFGDTALATSTVRYSHPGMEKQLSLRGSTFFAKRKQGWRIVHEHYSTLDLEIPNFTSLLELTSYRKG